MPKRYIFIFLVFLLVFLVVQFFIEGYKNSVRSETLRLREQEIASDEREIAGLTSRAKWSDTAAARIYLKKLNNNVALPGERLIVITPKIISGEYSVNEALDNARDTEMEKNQETIPEKWNKLLFGGGI